jgi:hypothetical protein
MTHKSIVKPKRRLGRHPADVQEEARRKLARCRTALAPARFEELKEHLLKRLLRREIDPHNRKDLSLTVNEAAALAWTTPYPLLVLPSLLSEKVSKLRQHQARQNRIRMATLPIVNESLCFSHSA